MKLDELTNLIDLSSIANYILASKLTSVIGEVCFYPSGANQLEYDEGDHESLSLLGYFCDSEKTTNFFTTYKNGDLFQIIAYCSIHDASD